MVDANSLRANPEHTMRKALLLFMLTQATVSLNAKTLFLDPGGTDSGNCQVNACRTINYAQQQNLLAGDIVKLGTGTYLLTSPIVLSVSGTAPQPITYTAYNGSKPVFTGAKQITTWTLSTNCDGAGPNLGTLKCYSASVAGFTNFDYLIYNLQTLSLADAVLTNARRTQSVNTPASYNTNAGLPGGCNPCYDKVLVNTSELPVGGLVHNLADVKYYNFSNWNVDLLRLLSSTPNGNTTQLQFSGAANAFAGVSPQGRYLIVNALEFFQSSPQAGTFYVDCGATPCSGQTSLPAGSTIYYVATNSNEHPNTDKIFAPQITPLLTANGVKYVKFSGVYFVGDNFVTPSGTYPNGGYTSNTGQPNAPAAVSFVNTSGVTLDSSVIAQTSGWGLEFTNTSVQTCPNDPTNLNNALTKSVLYDIGTSGVRIGRFPPDSQDTGNCDKQATSNTTVDNNLFKGMGRNYPGGEAGCVWIGSSHHNTITNNECADSYGGGIAVGPAVSFAATFEHDNTVSHNLWHDLGEGVIVDFGCVHFANRGGASLQGSNGDTFKNNVCHDITHAVKDTGNGGIGIYIDNFSQHVHVNYNLVYRASGALYFHNQSTQNGQNLCGSSTCDNTVFNNVFAYAGYTPGFSAGQGAIKRGGNDLFLDFTFKHNIVYYDIGGEAGPQWVDSNTPHAWDCANGVDCTAYFNFLSNGYWNPNLTFPTFYTTTPFATYTSLMTWQASQHPHEDQADGTGHSTYGTPAFTNPGLPACGGNDDYTFANNTLTTAIAFDTSAAGFGSTYSAGRGASATLCTAQGSCPTVTATFPLQLITQCSQW
jgi:hypothetical protein